MQRRVPSFKAFSCSRPLLQCEQCGEKLYVPEWSEFDEGRVRHLWHCEACDCQFETVARLAAA